MVILEVNVDVLSYLDALALILLVTAFLAIHFKNAFYSIISFGAMFVSLSAFYFGLNAQFAAVFQLVVAVGTIAVFFLVSEVFTSEKDEDETVKDRILGVIIALTLSIPSFIIDLKENHLLLSPRGLSFPYAMWRLRVLDVIAQGVVALTLALGIMIILKRRSVKVMGEK